MDSSQGHGSITMVTSPVGVGDKLHYDELAFCSHLKVVLRLSLITAAQKKISKSTQKIAFILPKSYLRPPFYLPGFSSPHTKLWVQGVGLWSSVIHSHIRVQFLSDSFKIQMVQNGGNLKEHLSDSRTKRFTETTHLAKELTGNAVLEFRIEPATELSTIMEVFCMCAAQL